jgi:hypothetical protein
MCLRMLDEMFQNIQTPFIRPKLHSLPKYSILWGPGGPQIVLVVEILILFWEKRTEPRKRKKERQISYHTDWGP